MSRSTGGFTPLHVHPPSRTPSITVGGNVLEPKRIMLLGAPLSQDVTIIHHLQTTPADDLTKPERRRVRELVKGTLFDLFRMSKPGDASPTPAEDTEHPDDLAYGIDISFFDGTRRDQKAPESCCKPNAGRDIRLEIVGRPFRMDQIVGSRSDGKEWKTYFQDVDAFMFVVSLISYSQSSWRNTTLTRMQEYLILFESISQFSGLRTVPKVVLFNNFDLLRPRMRDYPVTDYFPEYLGSSDPSLACRLFADRFVELDRAQSITLYVTNEVEQDDEDLEHTVNELCPNMFPRALPTVPELPE